jgi:hypothetical protein
MYMLTRSALHDLATLRAVGPWLIWMGLSACATQPPPAPLPPEVSRPVAPLTLTLIDPGREPRESLRYHIVDGVRQLVKADLDMATGVALEGKKMVIGKAPKVRMTIALMGHVPIEGNSHTIESKVISCDIVPAPDDNPRVVESLRRRLQKTLGIVVTQTMDDRGFSQKVPHDPELSAEAEPSMREMLETMSEQTWAPLPEQPIGRGSKWRVEGDRDLGKIVVHERRLVTLEGRAGARLILSFETEQTAVPQPMHLTKLRSGARMYLVEHRVKARGRQVLDLEGLAPTGEASSELGSVMISVLNGRRMRMTIGNTTKATITRDEAPSPSQ